MKYSLASLFCHTRQPFSFLFHFPRVQLKITRRSIGELIFVAGMIAFNIGLFIKGRVNTIDQGFQDDLRVWIRPLGRIQIFNLIVMFIMITRASLLEFVFGMPFERGIAYHRWISRWFVFLFIVHGVLSWIRFQYSSIVFEPVSWGFYAGCLMLILFAFTFRPIRRTSWELFYYTHQLFAVVSAVLAAYHGTLTYPASDGFSFTWRVDSYILYFFIALYGVDRIIRFMFGWLFSTELISAKPEQIEVTRIEMKKSCFKLPYEEGQYVFVLIPAVSLFQWHPFSISSAPHEQNFTLHIKDSGGFTHKLRELAGKGEIRRIFVDGPYGNLSVNLNQYQVVILVAGGIGVTPMISILKHLVHKGLDNFTKVYFIWSVRDPLAFAEALNAAKSNPKVELKLFATRAKGASEGGITFTPSRPKMAEIFQEIKTANASCTATAALACGPSVVVSEVSELCASMSTCGNQFHFHQETFAF